MDQDVVSSQTTAPIRSHCLSDGFSIRKQQIAIFESLLFYQHSDATTTTATWANVVVVVIIVSRIRFASEVVTSIARTGTLASTPCIVHGYDHH